MIIELHAIQSFAPANLNRDDVGAPKDCTFGGVRRARVSSQSWKRAMRLAFRASPDIELGTRTKRAHEDLVGRIRVSDPALSAEIAEARAAVLLEAKPLDLSLKRADDKSEVKTGQLIFFRGRDLATLAALAIEYGDELDRQVSTLTGAKAKPTLSKELADKVKKAITSPGGALDVALFGRLMAELPEGNVDAACQVAHAIGTHRLAAEFDYYTAVDDLKPEDTEGADMIGTIEFNASCLYRYAVVDVDQLALNLGSAADDEHVATALGAFARAFVTAIPSGKQTTFAARNLPAAVLAVRRTTTGALNLVNAFVDPVSAGDCDIVTGSVRQMLAEYATLESMYGSRNGGTAALLLSSVDVDGDCPRAAHVDDIVAHVADV